ncbi:hypothetical protein, partial [Faecalibaculum rodentium]
MVRRRIGRSNGCLKTPDTKKKPPLATAGILSSGHSLKTVHDMSSVSCLSAKLRASSLDQVLDRLVPVN